MLPCLASSGTAHGSGSLYARNDAPKTAWERVGWWEARRIPYNLIVGFVGLLTCLVFAVTALAAEILFGRDFGLPNPPIFGIFIILAYAIAANICYTGGWMAELCVARLWPKEADKFASRSFLLGLAFSVLLTLAPCVILAASGLFALTHHFHHTH